MNVYFLSGAILCFILGLAHSILGEYLIFIDKREPGRLVPTRVAGLRNRHVRILWVSWHTTTLFGWGIGALLFTLATTPWVHPIMDLIIKLLVSVMMAASILVLIGTKGKHPGWVVLAIIGILLLIGG